MLYFLSSTIIELGLDVSWWFFKKGTFLLYDGIVYLVNYNKETPTEVENISNSIVIIENEEILDELREIKSKLSNTVQH
tara:strand:+ start:219 stop:455 length:237 start_codon:yes stop_codon:yes gene_type:complete